ncbi:uncharacterized protein LOC111705736 [Eurytemora carolleeae]|uniref:uncharacterized protein LOC111705736 n=1 Tax=Eurytemora carolleeae TaxID=1294199 RepID=UPI000C78E099|nr:uncharacterized protein LOC111705736 [Eurytemora carolleeae]|eukprot:XP_023334151.1 uncharacterized protein LOC111705736 [Eurytemora affinis]
MCVYILVSKLTLLLLVQTKFLAGHLYKSDQEHMQTMREFSESPGLMVSFTQRIVSGEFFLGFHGWDRMNRKYGVSNITYIVRIEFDRWTYRRNRLEKTYHRFWIPGTVWVNKIEIGKHYYNSKFNYTRSRNTSVIDLWVEPICFLKNHGVSRIYRVTRTLRMHVYNLRWLAKLNFNPLENYGTRELKQFGKFLTQQAGVNCAWLYPSASEGVSLLVKFSRDNTIRGKRFFSPEGFHNWDDLNDEYQVRNIAYLNGWRRAVVELADGLHCKSSMHDVGLKYKKITGISAVYRDEYKNCRMTFRLLVKFDRRSMTPAGIHFYNDWSSLNYMYGVVNTSYHEDQQLIAHLEFEPGLYTNQQMKIFGRTERKV